MVPGHTLNISSLRNNRESSHRSPHTRLHVHTRSLAVQIAVELAIYNTNAHKTQTAAAADRKWDSERVTENEEVQIQARVFTLPSISTFSISLQCTLNTNGQGSRSHAPLMIYNYGK